jgi:type I restriction enzyme S subunit
MAVENLITQHLGIWTSAIKTKSAAGRGSSKKLELVGIKKLRELILELAVRGKLVPQDPNDEPASELLKKASANKESLIKEGLLKPSRSKKKIKEEHFYKYPSTWVTANIGDLINVVNGRAYKKHEMLSEGTPLLRVGNLFTSNEWYYSDIELGPEKYIDDGDLIYAWSASFGPFIWDGGKVIYHYHIWKMDIFSGECLSKHFSKLFLQAISARIKASGNGIAMIHMTKERMEKVMHPIPPLNEQHRIVAKVDELMALCDQLEAQTEASIDAHKTLVEVLLATLNDAKDADELNENWQTISQHFDVLFTTQASIDQLKQTILQLAVMGKLVKQDPKDEPASKLLERIATEKQQLIKDGKIKKQKPLPPISDEEKPFELPNGWECVRLGDLINLVSGQHLRPNEYSESVLVGGVPYITGPAEFGEVNPTYSKYTVEKRALAQPNNILVTCKGAGLGKFNVADEVVAISRQLMAIQPIKVNASFLKLIVSSLYSYFQSMGVGIAIPGISREHVTDIVMKLPPSEEQQRIVSKVDELMALCDSLKARLNQTQTTQLDLAESIVSKAVGREIPNSEIEVEIKTMKITTALTISDHYINQDDGILALLIKNEGGEADAKTIWNKSNFDLPKFYKQLKKEIKAGYINQPSKADFEH